MAWFKEWQRGRELLCSMGVDTQAMQQKILEALVNPSLTAARTFPRPTARKERPKAACWKKYSRDLTKAARDGELDLRLAAHGN